MRQARKSYTEHAEQLAHGINPAEKSKKEKSKNITVNDLIGKYEAYCLAQAKKSTKDEIRALRKDIGARLGHRFAHTIETDEVREILTVVLKRKNKRGDERSPQMANHLRSYTHRMFKLAVDWQHVPLNPVTPVERLAPTRKRTRVLSFQEIYTLWHGLPQTQMTSQVQMALKFMLATMQRGIDVRSMLWTDINVHDALWTIPAPKNKRAWRIPLNKYALEILEHMKESNGDFNWPFSFSGENPMSQGTLDHNVKDNLDILNMAHFTPHDLRRTAATLIASLGCPRYWVSLMLNHTDQSVTDIYDQYSYDLEKRNAANVLEFAMDNILGAKSVEDVPVLDNLRELVREAGLIPGKEYSRTRV